MAINAAYAWIKQALASCPTPPLKLSLRHDQIGSFVEVRFVTPEVGRRLRAELDVLSGEIGRRIEVAANAVPQELQQTAVACLGGPSAVVGLPSIFPQLKTVRVASAAGLDHQALAAAQARFQELTGWSLVVQN